MFNPPNARTIPGVTQKVWTYVVRQGGSGIELLVFDQVDVNAGVQIPAGTVEQGEDIQAAAKRELMEESGVRLDVFSRIAVIERNWHGEDVRAHLFAAWAWPETADEWVHQVTGTGEDEGMRFRFYWLPRIDWHKLYGDFKLGYPALDQFIANSYNFDKP